MGLITTVSSYRGSLSPQPIYYPTPQHKYQHTYKLAYHNSITSFSISNLFNYRNYHVRTALHELVDNHVFLTSARCKWHSNPNFWGEMEWRRFVWCASQTCWCQSSQVSWNFGMHGRHVKLVKAHWHECFASRPVGEASVLTHFLRRQNWRATGVMKVIILHNNKYDMFRPGTGTNNSSSS